jgi:hypothetical protein
MKENAEKYGEYCHGLVGKALRSFMCDAQGETIEKGTECVAADLFPTKPEKLPIWHETFIELNPTQEAL